MESKQDAAAALLDRSTVIITGASSGLGAEFARQLADRASCLVLAARNADALQDVASELRARNPALSVIVCACDLSTDEGRAAVWSAVDSGKLMPNVLINNAGLGDYGPLMDAEAGRVRLQIDLNITALTMLAREFGRRFRASTSRSPGGIMNISSLAASLPMPDLAVYAASKAYVTSLSEALAIEFSAAHLRVLAVCPGPTPTNFSKTARRAGGADTDRAGQGLLRVTPQYVVATSLAALERGKPRHFPGWGVRIAAFIFELAPRFLLRAFLRLRWRRGVVE
jgi:short-subunit dehydrogenase